MRRAVIIVNSISLVFTALGFLSTVGSLAFADKLGGTVGKVLNSLDDDGNFTVFNADDDLFGNLTDDALPSKQDVEKSFDAAMQQARHVAMVFLVIHAIMMPLKACAISGAIKYSVLGVYLGLLGYIIEFVYKAISMNIVGMILPAFFAYPHVVLVNEMKSGVMSPENYELEKYSCCCV